MSDPIVVQEQEDSLSTFGKYVVGELREMSSSQVCIIKIKIQQAIMDGQAQCVMEHLGGTQQPGLLNPSASDRTQQLHSSQ